MNGGSPADGLIGREESGRMSISNILLNIVGVIVALIVFVFGYALVTEHPSLLGVLAAIALLAFLFLRIRRRRGA